MQNSSNNQLRIAEIEVGSAGGRIGITFAPGKVDLDRNHNRDLATDLDVIADWNAAMVVTLVEAFELDRLKIPNLGKEVRRRFMEWRHLPIEDVSTPDSAFEAAWPAQSAQIRSLLDVGGRVLVHCRGGLGRAGMIAARILVEMGAPPAKAMKMVRDVRRHAIETSAQERWVAAGKATPALTPARSREATCDRAVGALVGLAVGDAVGTTLEFTKKPKLAVLDDMIGGGPFDLKPGEWTDDTAMALALADSLLKHPELDPRDLMTRFGDWHDNGAYSCTGVCFDIGITTRGALDRFERNGDPLAGSTDPQESGNGALMRLSPVAIRHWADRDELRRVADLQTRTTHASADALQCSLTFAELLADAIGGKSTAEVLGSDSAGQIQGGWRGLHRRDIEGSGYVVRSLQAAVWSVSRTTNFRSAILLAANLGRDADTTAAIAGQLAGALYGLSGIPQEWLAKLAWRDRIEDAARRLFEAGQH